jgi:hypothetical protein
MAPAKSGQSDNIQPAPPRQDQTDQGPTPWANYTEQTEQAMKQEGVVAIVTPGNSTIKISEQQKADLQKATDLARYQPLPDDDDADFANEPQAEQPMEQEVVVAIMRPGDSSIAISDQERSEYEERARLARYEPLPDEDDFADEPLPKPYDPESATVYEWAKPEAWIQEKDSEGNDYRRVSLSIINFKQDGHCGAINSRRLLDTRDHGAS